SADPVINAARCGGMVQERYRYSDSVKYTTAQTASTAAVHHAIARTRMRWLALIERAERSAVTPGAGGSTVEKLAEHEADAERGEQAGQRPVLDLALERADRVPGLAARLLGGTPDPLAPLARGIAPQVLQGIGNSGQVRAQRFDLGFQLLDVFVGTRAHVRPPS